MEKPTARQSVSPLMKTFTTLCLAMLLLFANAVYAADLEKGKQALKDGDYAAALEEFQTLAQEGNASGEFNLGVMYDRGWGVTQDYGQAVFWYRRAAGQGHIVAENNLGAEYARGNGVSQDYAEAAKWYGMAADRGFAYAQSSLAFLYMKGSGVKQDLVVAYALDALSASGLAANSNAAATAARMRSELLGSMTPDQIAAGRALMLKMQSDGILQTLARASIAP